MTVPNLNSFGGSFCKVELLEDSDSTEPLDLTVFSCETSASSSDPLAFDSLSVSTRFLEEKIYLKCLYLATDSLSLLFFSNWSSKLFWVIERAFLYSLNRHNVEIGLLEGHFLAYQSLFKVFAALETNLSSFQSSFVPIVKCYTTVLQK